jgi:hypothetical protein
MSRLKVRTKSEENAPIATMLAMVSRSFNGCRLILRATGHSGVATSEATSHNAVVLNANEPSGRSGSNRPPTYAWSRRTMKGSFLNIRVDVRNGERSGRVLQRSRFSQRQQTERIASLQRVARSLPWTD